MAITPYYQDDYITLYHGDCLQHLDVLGQADVMVTDPPYGTQPNSNKVGYGRRVQESGFRGQRIANDVTTDVRDTVLEMWGERPVMAFGSPRFPDPPGNWDHRLVWDKRQPGLNGGPWRYTHETIFVRGEGWVRTSASAFSIISVPSGNGSPEKRDHVHAKPVALMERLIVAAPPGVIIDPFAGSGSTLRAAKNLGRKAIGFEIEEKYCEITAQRLAQEVLFS
ncbi:MAG: site-specific DNA-methyltransferase [Corynebacterium casei]|uniref:DNA-methyltransferase n=1 Tax=Corynebacterium casei TaxID=160386 RepID=UPI002648AD8D|nr:site-specific DNA-methyltransferase [Corynebacterium casei]MDN6286081.1 site-specific DNA-methyltransferase [Corynebacterium casei]